jgi:alpha-tubulin suppressor-like RCC1 family protein
LQWGTGFAATDRQPQTTLKGKNIVKLALTQDKVYALSKSGTVYVFAASAKDQQRYPDLAREPWYAFWRSSPGISVVDLKPRDALTGTDRIVDIAAGESHVLARSSKGKIYSHPVDLQANAAGQLGLRQVNTSLGPRTLHPQGFEPDAVDTPIGPKPVGLASSSFYPKAWINTPAPDALEPAQEEPQERIEYIKSNDEKDILFCRDLYQIPSLKEIKVTQIAVGNRHNIVKTEEGRVLGFGSNNCA